MTLVIDVDGGDYDTATESLAEANRLSAGTFDLLVSSLDGSGGMAGDDASSRDFAERYDVAAREAVDAYAELVEAMGVAAELAAASADNHRRAEEASVYGGASTPVRTTDVEAVTVVCFVPPSALGGTAEQEPEGWHLVADELQGLAWPNADTGRLRTTSGAWREAAGDATSLGDYCTTTLQHLAMLRSPEIPAAESAVGELRDTCEELAATFTELALACEEYADQVEAHRDVVKGILRELVVELGLAAAGAVVAGLLSFGAGAAVGAGAVALRIRSAATKIVAALTALRTAAHGVASTRLAAAANRLRPLRTRLQKFRNARQVRRKADEVEPLDDWRHLPPKIPYTWDEVVNYRKGGPKTPMEHIKEGHWPNSTPPRKGHFSDGITEKQVEDYVGEALRKGQARADDSGTFDYAFGEVIGTNRDGTPAKHLVVHVRDGVVHSAYPA